MLVAFTLRKKNIPFRFLGLFAFVSITFLISLILHPEYSDYYSSPIGFNAAVLTFSSSIFGYLFVEISDDSVEFGKCIYIAAILNFIFYLWLVIGFLPTRIWITIDSTGRQHASYYSMSFSYGMLFPVLVFLKEWIVKRNLIDLIGAITGLISIVLFGSRGALLCLIIFGVLYWIFILGVKRKIIIFFTLLIFLIFIAFIWKDILEYLAALFPTSRTLELLSGGLLYINDRNSIWIEAIEYILKNPFGYGPMADQYLLGEYSHNVVIELMITFGVIPGIALLIFFMIKSMHILTNPIEKENKLIFMIFFSIVVGKLLFSSSFWYETYLWTCIALFHKYRKRHSIANMKHPSYRSMIL
jgi:hypothetical protein